MVRAITTSHIVAAIALHELKQQLDAEGFRNNGLALPDRLTALLVMRSRVHDHLGRDGEDVAASWPQVAA